MGVRFDFFAPALTNAAGRFSFDKSQDGFQHPASHDECSCRVMWRFSRALGYGHIKGLILKCQLGRVSGDKDNVLVAGFFVRLANQSTIILDSVNTPTYTGCFGKKPCRLANSTSNIQELITINYSTVPAEPTLRESVKDISKGCLPFEI